MNRTAWLQDRRMQKFRDVLNRWERKPSRRGLATAERAAASQRRPALTASARAVREQAQVGTKKRSSGRTKKLTRKAESVAPAAA
jgi:hypothetical protein